MPSGTAFSICFDMKFLLITFTLFGFSSFTQLYASAFTADAVQIRGVNISHAKMYWLDGDVRFEYTEDGISMTQIFDNKNHKTIWLDNENKYYLIKEMPEAEKVITGARNKKNSDPCKQFVNADCVYLKKAKMNGREAEKWLITLGNDGSDFHIIQWIDIKYKNILRQENSDGTGLSVHIKDDQERNGRKVRKLTMMAFSASGEQQQGTQWYDSVLDIVVRQEYQYDIIDELKNIKVGKVNKDLFTVPENYTLYDASLNTVQQPQNRQPTDKTAGNN